MRKIKLYELNLGKSRRGVGGERAGAGAAGAGAEGARAEGAEELERCGRRNQKEKLNSVQPD